MFAPILIRYEPRWRPPVVNAECPSCGRVATRTASSWRGHIDGRIIARFACYPLQRAWDDVPCNRVFDIDLLED